MRSASGIVRSIRLACVLALGAFTLHQARYVTSYGGDSSDRLADHGHGYLADLLPYLGMVGIAAVVATVLASRLAPERISAPWVRRTAVYSAALLAIYLGQELIEGALSAGHPAGLDILLTGAGWCVVPLAALLGAMAALVMRALEGIETILSPTPRHRRRPRAPLAEGRRRAAHRSLHGVSPLATGLASRPPPRAALTAT